MDWDSIVEALSNINYAQLPTQLGTASTAVAVCGGVFKIYSYFTQSGLPKKVKKEIGSRALFKGLAFFGLLLDRYPPEQVIALIQRTNALSLEMQEDVHKLAQVIGLVDLPPPEPAVPLSPEEEDLLWTEIQELYRQFLGKLDIADVKGEVEKAHKAQEKILAKFRAPLEKQREREAARYAQLEAEIQRSKERLHDLFVLSNSSKAENET